MSDAVVATALLLLIGPIPCGWVVGGAIRRLAGERLHGILSVPALLLLPAVVVVVLDINTAVLGYWDAVFEGLLLGVGTLLGAHRIGGAPEKIVLGAVATVAALGLLELAVRTLLPPPPAFPPSEGVHLLLADAIRAAGARQGWDMRSREIACSLIYGDQYDGMLDVSAERDIQRPASYMPRTDARRRALHVGDSMAFGFGVDRADTFISGLGRLEPNVEHVNAAMPGIAPDAYLALVEAWTGRQRFDEVLLYVFVDNDLRDLDGPYPCCDFEPLLTYHEGRAALRCATASAVDLDRAGWQWLRYNSPPPYLLRAIIDHSRTAAYVSALLVESGQRYSISARFSRDDQLRHLTAIMRTLRDRLHAAGTRFAVVILPGRRWIEGSQPRSEDREQIAAILREEGIPALDPGPMLQDVAQRGEGLFIGPQERNDPHFNPAGHRSMAQWLHEARREEP